MRRSDKGSSVLEGNVRISQLLLVLVCSRCHAHCRMMDHLSVEEHSHLHARAVGLAPWRQKFGDSSGVGIRSLRESRQHVQGAIASFGARSSLLYRSLLERGAWHRL